MGLPGEIYNVFGLIYFSVLAGREHKHFSRSDWAFIGATVAFSVLSILSFFKQWCGIPWGYKCRFFCKSCLRGILGPLLSLFYYPVLFYSRGWVNKALTFSNEAHDGVERTRQLEIFELDADLESPYRYSTKHDLFWHAKKKEWGYKRLVGEIWVKLRFTTDKGADLTKDYTRMLQTSECKSSGFFLQYKGAGKGDTTSKKSIGRGSTGTTSKKSIDSCSTGTNPGGVNGSFLQSVKARVKVTCLDCICAGLVKVSCLNCTCKDLESSSNPANPSGTAQTAQASGIRETPVTPAVIAPTTQTSEITEASRTAQTVQASGITADPSGVYKVTITRRRAICRFPRWECSRKVKPGREPEMAGQVKKEEKRVRSFPGWTWSLRCTEDRKWTLFQIHQYMLCLDAWGNHPKQGIWKPHEPKTTCCSGDTFCCNAFTRIKGILLWCLPGHRSANQEQNNQANNQEQNNQEQNNQEQNNQEQNNQEQNNQENNQEQNNQASRKIKFRYCYRHDELINAIEKNKRLTSKENDSTWYTVV